MGGVYEPCAASYPGQVLYLRVRSDAGVAAVLPAVLHIPQVEHTGYNVQQLLQRQIKKDGGQREEKNQVKNSGNEEWGEKNEV